MSIPPRPDAGTPVVDSDPGWPHSRVYRAIGAKIRNSFKEFIAAADPFRRVVRLWLNQCSHALSAFSEPTSRLCPPRDSTPDHVESVPGSMLGIPGAL